MQATVEDVRWSSCCFTAAASIGGQIVFVKALSAHTSPSTILSSRPQTGKATRATAPKFTSPPILPCGAARGPAVAPAPNGNRSVRGPPEREAFACRSQVSPPLFLVARAAGMQQVCVFGRGRISEMSPASVPLRRDVLDRVR